MAAQETDGDQPEGTAGDVDQQAPGRPLLDVDTSLEIEVEPPAGRGAPLLPSQGADDADEGADGAPGAQQDSEFRCSWDQSRDSAAAAHPPIRQRET